MSYRCRSLGNRVNVCRNIQWKKTFYATMDIDSDSDKNINSNEQQNQFRSFYNGEETVSLHSSSEATVKNSVPFQSLSDQKSRGRRSYRRPATASHRGRNRGRPAYRKQKSFRQGKRHSDVEFESESENASNSRNYSDISEPVNLGPDYRRSNMNTQDKYNSYQYEFLPNSVNVNRQKSRDNELVNEYSHEIGSQDKDNNEDTSLNSKLSMFRKAREEYVSLSRTVTPSEIIMDYRQRIEKLSNECTAQNLRKIDKISSMGLEDESYSSIFTLHRENLILQQREFDACVANMKHDFNVIHGPTENIVKQADDIKLRIENECNLFQRTLPAYGYKSAVLNALMENQVIIISADCSYFFNIVTPIIIQSKLPSYSIFSCGMNNMANEWLGKEIESIIKRGLENYLEINHITDDKILNFLSESKSSDNFVTIFNVPLKRSVSIDLSFAILCDLLNKRKDSKLILLISAFDGIKKYQSYFSKLKVFSLEVPKLLLPVKTVWKKESLTLSTNYKEDIVCTALSIHILNEPGNVLAFLANEAEAKIAVAMFNKKIQELTYDDVECVLLYDNSCNISHFKNQSASNKRTIFFASNCAEVVPIPSVRYVIDCGLKRDYMFDCDKNLDVLATKFCSRTKAKLRKSLIGVYRSGICYRIYNKENFCNDMSSSERPDILTLNPFNTFIKIFHYMPDNALSVEFVEPLSDVLKYNNIKLLKNFNAVKNGKLTQLGKKMVQLPFPARYSKLILQGIDWGYAYEAAILVAYFSTDLFVFKYSKDEDQQRVIDAAKLELVQHESDAISFLYVFKFWMENNYSSSWCDRFHINSETLNEIKIKVSEICQYVNESLNENILQEFSECDESAPTLIEMLFQCFGDNLCVFSGHYRNGYRILSSRRSAFLHPSSMLSRIDHLPQLIIFNKMICSNRNFLVGITAIPQELVLNNIADKSLEFDYSDIFERSLVSKTIEPVGERIIKQILLGQKGKKLLEIEDFIKKDLKTESIVIEPSVEKGSVCVYALESYLNSAVNKVDQILKSNLEDVINAEQIHILELKKGKISVPLEIKCVMGAKITSVKILDISNNISAQQGVNVGTKPTKDAGSSVQYSINLTWIRRSCNGICFIDFTPTSFMTARKLATKNFCLLGSEVYVEVSRRADYQLVCTDIPEETKSSDIENALKKLVPNAGILKIELKYIPPFETSPRDIEEIKMEIQESCEEFTNLSDFEIIVPKPKDSATIMKAYINVFCLEDLTETARKLSNTKINNFKITAQPVYRSVIKVSSKVFKALDVHLEEEIKKLELDLKVKFPGKEPFRYQKDNVDQDLVLLKLLSNNIKIIKELQRVVNELLEGEVLNKNIVTDIHKLFCHGGHMWLRTLEKTKKVYILEEYNSKIIRVYGTQENCFQVKECILNFLEDTENEAVETIILNNDKNNRILLKSIIKEYGVNLEPFVELCNLRSAVLDIRSCRLLLHGSRDSIDKAKDTLNLLSSNVDSADECSLLCCGEICPVCSCPAFNLTFRLQHCGHVYCSECIRGLVEQARFPIQCCAENCSEDVVLDDIARILDEDDARIKKLLHSSLVEFLEKNRSEIYYCPAPDCSMFSYKDEVFGKWKCPLCQNDICTSCNVVYHHGFTCDVYQGSRKDPDYSFKVWKQGTTECKACPQCKIPIERNAGCDHMTCIKCQTHFCWVCVRAFHSEHEVYNHIPFCDQHPKW